jgi:Glycosyltransferase family 87
MRLPLLAIALFWVAVEAIERLDWDRGVYKSLVILGVLLALLPLMRRAGRRLPAAGAKPERGLVVAVGLLAVAQVAFAAAQLRDPQLIDIATTTLAAGDALLSGQNPYVLPIDPAPSAIEPESAFSGFKYSPLMALAYIPMGTPFGPRGVVLTNLPLQLATAWLVFLLARSQGTTRTGLVAAIVYLALPLVPGQVFEAGITELVAVLPLLVALLFANRRAWLAGLCVGLSISAKLLPGALFLPCCLPSDARERLRYGAGIAIGLLPLLLAALWSPIAVWNNLVVFNLFRAVDSTSWLAVVPPVVGPIARGVFAVVFLGIAAVVWRAREVATVRRCGLGAIAILTALLSGPVAHNNYQLWWLPLFSVVLAVSLEGRSGATALALDPKPGVLGR